MSLIIDIKGHGNKFEYSDNTTKFYNEIRSNDVLSKDEERHLFRQLLNGTKSEKMAARNRLIECNLKLAVSSARAYGKNRNLEDLISEAYVGLMDAIDHFDLQKAVDSDVKFSTYALEYMRRNIDRFRVSYGDIVRQTNRVKTIHHLAKAKNSFMQKFEREPSSNELLDWLNENYLDEKLRIDDPNDVIDMQCTSIDEAFENSKDTDKANSEFLQTYNTVTSNEILCVEDEEKAHNEKIIDSVLAVLSERDREILKMYFGIGQVSPISVYEIAYKTSLSPERIRQIKTESIDKLKKKFGGLDFQDILKEKTVR